MTNYKIRLATLSDTKYVIRTLRRRYRLSGNTPNTRFDVIPRLFDVKCDVDVNRVNLQSYCNIVCGTYGENLRVYITDDNNIVLFIGTIDNAYYWARMRFVNDA